MDGTAAEAAGRGTGAGTAPPEAAVAPPPPPPKRRRRRGRALIWRLMLVLVAFVVAVGAWGLTGKPIALPVWAVAEIEARMNTAFAPVMPEGAISVGAVEVAVDDDWVPRIRLEDLRLLKPDGAALLSLPEMRMSLDPGALMAGQLQPRHLVLSGAQLSVRRDRSGRYDFAFGTGAAMPEIASFGALFELADRVLAQPAAASLRTIEAEALGLRLADDRTGRTWELGDGRLTLENRDTVLAAQMGLTLLAGDGGAARAEVTVVSEKAADAARVSVAIDGITAADLAAFAPLLAPLGLLEAPISGRLSAGLDSGGVTALEGTLSIGAGALRPTPAAAPIAFDHATVALRYDPAGGRMVLDDLQLDGPSLRLAASGQSYLLDAAGRRMTGPLGGALPETFLTQFTFREVMVDPAGVFEEPARFSSGALDVRLRMEPFSLEIGQLSLAEGDRRLTARGRIGADARGWSAALDLRLNEIDHDRLIALWPVALVPRTRDWVAANVLHGRLFDVAAALRITPGTEPRLHLGWSFEEAEVRFVPSLPPVLSGFGYAAIDDLVYTVVLSRGRIAPPMGGSIDVSGSVFRVPDITRRPARAEVKLTTTSSLTAALSLLDQPPFQFMTKANRPVDLGEGQARITSELRLPLQKKIALGDVDYRVEGTVTGFRSDRLVEGRVVTAPALTVRADPQGMSISGAGHLGKLPFDATYTQGFAPEARGKAEIVGQVELSAEAADDLGLGLPSGMVSGRGAAQVTVRLVRDQPARLSLVSDLNRIGLAIPELGWSKPAAGTGSLRAEVELGAVPKVDRLAVEAAGLTAEGSVTMRAGGGLDAARFSRVTLNGWLDGPVEITGRGAGKPVGLAMTGGTVDIRRMPDAGARKSGGRGGGPLRLSLDRLVISSGVALTGFRGDFTLSGGIKGNFTARVNGGSPVSGNVAPAPRGTAVRFRSADAGATLREAGLFQSASGGALSVLLVPRDGNGNYDGQARITDTRVRNANVLAELLNAISVVGLLEQLDGSGLVFNEVQGEFLLTPRAVQITRGSAVGASLGVSMAGVYQTGSGRLDMQGVISPIYMVNGIGALLTRRGEGLFGFNYALRGTAADPQVDVNPLSILTPGMFREIFRSPPPVLGESRE